MLEEVFDVGNNLKAYAAPCPCVYDRPTHFYCFRYRDVLSKAKQPLIPYIGLYSKYLFAIEENNPTWEGVSAALSSPGGKELNFLSGLTVT